MVGRVSYFSAKMQLVYSIVPADWALNPVVIAMKECSTPLRSPEREPNHQMQLNVLPRTPFFFCWGLLPFSKKHSQHILSPTDRTKSVCENLLCCKLISIICSLAYFLYAILQKLMLYIMDKHIYLGYFKKSSHFYRSSFMIWLQSLHLFTIPVNTLLEYSPGGLHYISSAFLIMVLPQKC